MGGQEPVDHYELLGVPPDASAKDIKRAYKKLVHAFHPDRRPGPTAEVVLRRLNESFAVLRDPEKRQHFDWLRAQRQPPKASTAPPPKEAAAAKEAGPTRTPPPSVDKGREKVARPASTAPRPRDEDEVSRRREGRVRRHYAQRLGRVARREGAKTVAQHAELLDDLAQAYESEERPARRAAPRRVLWIAFVVVLFGLAGWAAMQAADLGEQTQPTVRP
jgi:curved DNA-binding protein CbpA